MNDLLWATGGGMASPPASVSPPQKVRAALPGTLAELRERTGYPTETILRMITQLRREGVRVNAIEDGVTRNVPVKVKPDPDWVATTVFREADRLASVRQEE